MNIKSLLIGGVAAMLTVSTVKAQIYHEEDKEDLRAFMRQGTNDHYIDYINYERLGLTVDDTLSWYENEDWVSKVKEVSWAEFESMQRIDSIEWNDSDWDQQYYFRLECKLKLSSPILISLKCPRNNLSELDISKNIREFSPKDR